MSIKSTTNSKNETSTRSIFTFLCQVSITSLSNSTARLYPYDHLLESDVDMIIVSSQFEGINWIKRIREVADLWEGLVLLEPLCYTPQEFEEKRKLIGIVNQAVKEGVEV